MDEHACWGPAVAVRDGTPTAAGIHHAGRRTMSAQSVRGELLHSRSETHLSFKRHYGNSGSKNLIMCDWERLNLIPVAVEIGGVLSRILEI